MSWLALRAVGCNDKGTIGTISPSPMVQVCTCSKVHRQLHKADFEFVRIFEWDADSNVVVDCLSQKKQHVLLHLTLHLNPALAQHLLK